MRPTRAAAGARSVRELLDHASARLAPFASSTVAGGGTRAGVALARELVAAVLECSPSSLMLHGQQDTMVDVRDVTRVDHAIDRLARGMPFAYAVSTAAFRHLTLHVDERVLIPRPETELLIDHVLRLSKDTPGGLAVDIGTGSGAIALSLASEAHFDRVIATDISTDALTVARANAQRLGAQLHTPVEFRVGPDLLPLGGESVAMLVSNPPYIAYEEASALPTLVRNWEPPTALFAADHGMARYEALLRGGPQVLAPGAWVVLECDSRRAEQTAQIARDVGPYEQVRVYDDLTGRARVMVARFTG